MHRLSGFVSVAAVGIVLLFVLSGLSAAEISPSHSGLSPLGAAAPTLAPTNDRPAQQLAWAQASLAAGSGPAAVRASVPSVGLWSNITVSAGNGPSGRVAAMTWDASDDYVLLYGGLGCGGSCVIGDTWTFSNGTWTNITVSVTGNPGPLLIPGLAVDPSSGDVILFGGAHALVGAISATWTYHAKTWTNLSSTVGSTPPARQLPAMATDSTDGEIVMTGGESASSVPLTDTWVFKDGTWTNETSISGSSANLYAPVASNDPAEHGVLLVGPQVGNNSRSATLVYSAGAWHNLTSTLPLEAAPMPLATAGYLPADQAVVVYSGYEYNVNQNTSAAEITWEFAGGVWTNVTDYTGAQPSTNLAPAGAVDPNSGAFILFGGETLSAPLSPWTYVLSGPPSVAASATRTVVDAGTSVAFSAEVTGGFEPTTVSWNFGDGSANVTTLSPAHSYASSGLYVAKVTATSHVGLSTTASVPVYVNPALSVNATVSGSPTSASPTAFALGVTGGTGPFTYAWTFGDSSATSTSSLADPTHTYSASGTFTASVRVTDSLGSSVNKTLSVIVAAAPSTASTSLTSGTGLGLLIGIIVLVLIVLALAVMLMRKPKSPVLMAPASGAPAPYTPPPPPPPAA